ncbi:retention module-containing protein [Photobacterium carnosum]|uniref:retention module-containing protein n=1 Tax=Photobacterium carnosum TaxID=2023717 RepID=UPI001E59C754|nr:retention module-containing protein [Photobacterium carnosum]MCD9538330.1 retention module-containing protein [Photobacterium carnosum]MCF2163087.1 retention module-containing protein [Photobacterium carnosum]
MVKIENNNNELKLIDGTCFVIKNNKNILAINNHYQLQSDEIIIANSSTKMIFKKDGIEQVIDQPVSTCSMLSADGLKIVSLKHGIDFNHDGIKNTPFSDNDISAIQNAILTGQDPTKLFEATAAGDVGLNGSSATASFITINYDNDSMLAKAGFDTAYEPSVKKSHIEDGGSISYSKLDAGVTITTIGGDNVINENESHSKVPVTGTVDGDVKVGDTVTVTVDGKAVGTATVESHNGKLTWTADVDGSVLDNATTDNVTATVTTHDEAGHSATATDDHIYTVDTDIAAAITITSIATDGVINAGEAQSNVSVTGTVGADVKVGDTVTVVVDGQTVGTTKVVEQDGKLTWTAEVDGSILDGATADSVTATVTTTDKAGNSATATNVHPYGVDTDIAAAITITSIATDGVINADEADSNVPVTGTVGKDVKVGDTVTITVDGQTVGTTNVVEQDGKLTWTAEVEGSALAGATADSVTATVTTTDKAGNSATATNVHPYGVDTDIAAAITITSIATDGVINADEADSNVPVTGTVGKDVKVGDTVTITVDGQTVGTTNVVEQDGKLTWTAEVEGSALAGATADSVTATVTTTDKAGNSATATNVHPYGVDTDIAAAITITSIATDNNVTGPDSEQSQAIIGTVGGDVKVNDIVTVTLDGKTLGTAKVQADKSWSLSVDGKVLLDANTDHVGAAVTTTDTAGNSKTVTAEHDYTVNVHPTIDINPITGDDVVTAHEGEAKQIVVTGTVAGDAQSGDKVVVTIDKQHYDTTVNSDLTWSVSVDSAQITSHSEVSASVTTTHYGDHNKTASSIEDYSQATIKLVEGDLEPRINPDYLAQSHHDFTVKVINKDLIASSLSLAKDTESVLISELNQLTSGGDALTFKPTTNEQGVITLTGYTAKDDKVVSLTLTPSADQQGDVTVSMTLTEYQPLDHLSQSGTYVNVTREGEPLNISVPVQLGNIDGDLLAKPIDVNVTIKDGALPAFGTDATLDYQEAGHQTQTNGSHIELTLGSDTIKSLNFELSDTAKATLAGLTSNTQETEYTVDGNVIHVFTGKVSSPATDVLTITIEKDGKYTVTQHQALEQNNKADDIQLDLGIKATDFDNDSTSSAISIKIEDGRDPVITNASSITVQEHNEKLDSAKGDLTVQVGSDNVIDYKVDIESFNKNVHITSHDQLVQLVQTSNGLYEGKVGDEVIFKYTLVSTGHYVFTMVGELDQTGTDKIKFGIPVYAIDADNDHSKAFNVEINVQDGTAVLAPESVIGNEDSKGIVIDPITVDLFDIDQGDKVDNLVIHVGDTVAGTFMLDGKVLNVIDGKIEISGDKFSTDTAKSTSKLDGLTFIPTHDYSIYNNGDKPLTFNMDVKVSTDTGPVVELSQPLNITVLGIADKPVWSSKTVDHYTINEDSTNGANLNILADPTDKDGSEAVFWYRISLPSDEHGKVYGDIAIIKDGVITIIKDSSYVSSSDVANVHIIPKANFSGDIKVDVQAFSSEKGKYVEKYRADSDIKELTINVLPIADEGSLSTSHIESTEDKPIALVDGIHLFESVDQDKSEHRFVQLSDLPKGFKLLLDGHVVAMDNGKYEIAYDQLHRLTLSPKDDISGDFKITVTGIIKDIAHITVDGKTEEKTDSIEFGKKSLDINIKGDPDTPVIDPDTTGGWESVDNDKGICTVINENGKTSLNINVSSGEDHHEHAPDKSETLSVVLSDIPEGVTFETAAGQDLPLVYAGLVNGKITYQLKLSASDGESINDTLKNLTIVAPKNSTDTIKMTMTTIVTEDDGKSSNSPITQEIYIHIVPQLAPLISIGTEDISTVIDWEPKADDGKPIVLPIGETLGGLTINGIEGGYSLFINGKQLTVSQGIAVLSSDQFQFLLSNPKALTLTAPHNSDKDTALTLDFTVAVDCGNKVTIDKHITETINVDIKAVVEDGGLDIKQILPGDKSQVVVDDGKFDPRTQYGEKSNPVHSDQEGKVDLSVAWDLDGTASDGSESIKNAVITVMSMTLNKNDKADFIVEYGQGDQTKAAISLGHNQWLVPESGLAHLNIQAVNGYKGIATVTVNADILDKSDEQINDTSDQDSKDITSEKIYIDFSGESQSGSSGDKDQVDNISHIELVHPSISGSEDTPTSLGSQLVKHLEITSTDSQAQEGQLTFIIKANSLPKGSVIEGSEKIHVEYNSSLHEYIVTANANNITTALSDLTLTTPTDYAGKFDLSVDVVNTNPNTGEIIQTGDVKVPVIIAPVVDELKDVTITTTDKEDSNEVILHVHVPLTDSSETVKTVTLTLADSKQGYFIDHGKSVQTIIVNESELNNIKFKPSVKHFSGEVKISGVVDIVDTGDGKVISVSGNKKYSTSVNIEPINDDIQWDVKDTTIYGSEDSDITLSGISGKVVDAAESISSIKLEHVPDGFIVHGAVNNSDGVWTIAVPKDSKSFNLNNISITPSGNFSGKADIQVVVYNQEEGTALPHENVYSKPITIDVKPVSDGVDTNINTNISGNENSPIILDLGIHAIDNKIHPNTHGKNVHENGAESLQITITNVPDSSSFTLPEGVAGSAEKQVDGSWVIKGIGSHLDTLIFHPGDANKNNWNGKLSIDIHAVDNGVVGTTVEKTIHVDVNAVNDAPVNHIPSDPLTVDEDKPLLIKGLSISDVDSHDDNAKMNMTVTLKVKDGHVSFADNVDTHGLNISYDKDHNMVINGNINTINKALAEGVTYLGKSNFSGVDTLTMVTDDNGNSGAGNPISVTNTININVTPKADAPSLSLSTDHLQTAAIQSSLGTMLPLIGLIVAASADASETLTIKISDLGSASIVDKAGNVIGTDLGNGEWQITAQDLSDVYIKDLDQGSHTIRVEAVSTESDGSQAISPPVNINVVVDDLSATNNVIGQNSASDQANLVIDSTAQATLLGGDGNDILVGGLASDILVGGRGDDILWGGDLDGNGDGVKDTFLWSDSDFGTANAPATDTIMDFEVGIDTINLGDALDSQKIQSLDYLNNHLNIVEQQDNTEIQIFDDHHKVVQNIILNGVSHNDLFGDNTASMTNEDKLGSLLNSGNLELSDNFGNQQENTLVADNQGESLFGFDGNDILVAGQGNDILTGGSGDDVFTWHETSLSTKTDTITDFELGKDKIDIRELLANDDKSDIDDLLKHVSADVDSKGNVNLTVDSDNGHTQNIDININPHHELGLADGASSADIVSSLFNHNAFQVDNNH